MAAGIIQNGQFVKCASNSSGSGSSVDYESRIASLETLYENLAENHSTDTVNLQHQIDVESSTRTTADDALEGQITEALEYMNSQLEAFVGAINTAIENEATTRETKDTELENQIASLGGTSTTDYVLGDDGTYYVYTAAGLLAWRETVTNDDASTNCVLMNSIDMSGTAWVPAGSASKPFTGTFDGGGHCLYGLKRTVTASQYCGLCYCIQNANIKNVSLTNLNFTINDTSSSSICVGGLAGRDIGSSSIFNCSVSGTITASTATFTIIGGLIGRGNYTRVSECSSTITIDGTTSSGAIYIGGLSGYNYYGSHTGCFSVPTLTGKTTSSSGGTSDSCCIGGIVGVAGVAMVANCMFDGTITGSANTGPTRCGGMVGHFVATSGSPAICVNNQAGYNISFSASSSSSSAYYGYCIGYMQGASYATREGNYSCSSNYTTGTAISD